MLEIDTIGTYNTFKATVGELLKTRGSFQAISATLHYKGMPRELLPVPRFRVSLSGIDACPGPAYTSVQSRPTFRRPRQESTLSSESSPSNTVREAFEPTCVPSFLLPGALLCRAGNLRYE